MVIDLPFLAAVIALIFGILILIVPRVLNFLVAIYLITFLVFSASSARFPLADQRDENTTKNRKENLFR
jgi:hypothetical protein